MSKEKKSDSSRDTKIKKQQKRKKAEGKRELGESEEAEIVRQKPQRSQGTTA